MKQVKTMKFPHSNEVYEIIDAKAREDIENLKGEATTTVTDDGNGNVVLTNVAIEEGEVSETDPTVPAWAKEPNKPDYTWDEITEKPFTDGKLNPECLPDDIGGGIIQENDPTVPDWAKTPEKPAYGWDEITDKPFTDGKLNAACLPDGVGSGGGAGVVTLSSTDNLNTIRQCGWYAWSTSVPTNAPLVGQYRTNCYMRVDSHLDGQSCVQTIWSNNEDAAGCFIRRQIRNNTLGEWEWTEPPMAIGVEYRTTERWRGYPVYTQLADLGTGATEKSVKLDLPTNTTMIRFSGTMNQAALPFFYGSTFDHQYNTWIHATQHTIVLHCNSGVANSEQHYHARVWYIKAKLN